MSKRTIDRGKTMSLMHNPITSTTSIMLTTACILSLISLASSSDDGTTHDTTTPTYTDEEHDNTEEYTVQHEIEAHYAVLFPWFVEAVGLIVFYILTRYVHWMPYTGIMFVVGIFMGVEAAKLERDDQLSLSILQWNSINSEVLLLIFLPGLVFRDAYGLNTHLFSESLWQCMIMAFPMVLVGTMLTACIGYYVLPYDWSPMLSLTFGSILAATDPVAVSALLNEVGAPPRLKMHISGESLLNDGSAIVFYTIFSGIFLSELGIPEIGEEVSVGEGFALFFKMSLGGALIGVAFALVLILILYVLNRRLNTEENVVNVAATIVTAYLCYYVADSVCHTSGVIAVVMCGIFTRSLGSLMVNDLVLLDNFWILVEHLLNTLLFTLGGVVWGWVISNNDGDDQDFTGTDYGYLFLLYFFVVLIRFALVFMFYPVLSRIGLGSRWEEAVFMSWGGLRGAVGISLAIALDNEVLAVQFEGDSNERYRRQTKEVFGMVGGIAFLTLMINATTAGPLLKKLGLTKISAMREKIVEKYVNRTKKRMLDHYLVLMEDTRYHEVEFEEVKKYIKHFGDISIKELHDACIRHTEQFSTKYRRPYLTSMIKFFNIDTMTEEESNSRDYLLAQNLKAYRKKEESMVNTKSRFFYAPTPPTIANDPEVMEATKELRKIFVELLRHVYNDMVTNGELDSRDGLIAFVLTQSLDITLADINKGLPLDDWQSAQVGNVIGDRILLRLNAIFRRPKNWHSCPNFSAYSHLKKIHRVRIALALMEAHRLARDRFFQEFVEDDEDLSEAEKLVMDESANNVHAAKMAMKEYDKRELKIIVSRLLSATILMRAARHYEHLCHVGLLTETEAEPYLEEIQESIDELGQSNDLVVDE